MDEQLVDRHAARVAEDGYTILADAIEPTLVAELCDETRRLERGARRGGGRAREGRGRGARRGAPRADRGAAAAGPRAPAPGGDRARGGEDEAAAPPPPREATLLGAAAQTTASTRCTRPPG